MLHGLSNHYLKTHLSGRQQKLRLFPGCTMWFLLLICISTVCAIPVKSPQNSHVAVVHVPLNETYHVTNASSVSDLDSKTGKCDVSEENMKAELDGAVSLNDSHNGTSPASDGGVPLNDTLRAAHGAQAGVVPLNVTHNATVQHLDESSVKLKPPQRESAETSMELHQNFTMVSEGDVLMQDDRNAVKMVWKDAVMPYVVSEELAHQVQDIEAAFKMISEHTCIRFTPRTDEFNYVKFKASYGCSSFVGCQGGAQPVYFGKTCSVGNLCHEIIHALGMHHEHTREDRDQYVSVQWQSIIPESTKNFNTKPGDTLALPYDMDSIMHYGSHFFSVDGSPTLVAFKGGEEMGQRTRLSHLDIQRINKLYHCDERRKSQ